MFDIIRFSLFTLKNVKHRLQLFGLQLTAFFVTHYFNIANKMMKET